MNFETNRVSQIKLYLILDLFVLILPLLTGLPITLVEKRYDDLLIMLSIYIPLCIVVIVQFILLRKYYLGKVFVNEEGVGYKYKNIIYKIFKWEEIIKVKIGQAYFVFYKNEKINRGKNIVEMQYYVNRKNEIKIMYLCKDICKLIDSKQKKYGFKVEACEYAKKLLEE